MIGNHPGSLTIVLTLLGIAIVGACWRVIGRRRLDSVALAVREGPKSPLTTLSFEEALSLEKFSAEIRRYELNSLTRATGLIPLQSVVQGVSIAERSGQVTLLCKMSEEGRRAYESGQVRLLTSKSGHSSYPVLQDVETGRTFEIMKGHFAKWWKVAEAGTLIVSAAHIISSIDISQKLSEANRKLDRLLTARRTDQTAKLERIFSASKERLIEGPTAGGISELRRYRDELRELRAAWRRDLANVIDTAPDPAKKPVWKF
jgi:hypothetical protein